MTTQYAERTDELTSDRAKTPNARERFKVVGEQSYRVERTNADIQMALQVVAFLSIRQHVRFKLEQTGTEESNALVFLVQDVADAIRIGLAQADFAELQIIADANKE
jgi:hypothetical protein